jgi:opacity protein-like surface antigen
MVMERFLMSRFNPGFLLLGMLALPLASPAAAQSEPETGIYAVARAGGTIDTEQKLDQDSGIFQDKSTYKRGITGEIGGGYDFGMFRIEQTIGYSGSDLNLKKAETDGFSANGRTRMFAMSVAGYVDIPLHRMIVPYVGGGVGVARVDARMSRADALTGASSSFSGKDWGLLMHADAGIGVAVAPRTTVEFGGRYTRVGGLKIDGEAAGLETSYKPKLSSISATLGVRYVF